MQLRLAAIPLFLQTEQFAEVAQFDHMTGGRFIMGIGPGGLASDFELFAYTDPIARGKRMVEVVSQTAVWYSTGLPAVPVRWVLIRDPKEEFKPQALLCTDLDSKPEQIISWFVRRWQMEATFQEVRQRLGFETQRHWSDMAVRRTAPALLGLFSLVTLFAHQYMANKSANPVRGAAWYEKQRPTFSDALALVRKELWAREATFCRSLAETDTVKVPRALMERLTDAVCYAA